VPRPAAFVGPTAVVFTTGQVNSVTIATTGFPAAALTESGTLPGGVTFIANGNGTATISGTPAAGTAGLVPYSFTITASNGIALTATETFKLTIDQPPVITRANNATFTVGKAGSFTITTTAGLPKTTTLSASGKLPSGVSFTAGSNGTATLHGTPAAGTGDSYTITLTAGNATGSQTTQTFTLNVDQAPTITSAAGATFTVGQVGSFTVTTKGFPAATITESGTLPSGVTLVNKGNGTAILSGKPTVKGSFPLTILVSDGVLPEALQLFDLTVE